MRVISKVMLLRISFVCVIGLFLIFSLMLNVLNAAPACGSLENAYGPFDYTNSEDFKNKLPIVEAAHFTPKVEGLIGGERGYLWSDIDYTLRAFPNHHRALYASVRYEVRERRKSQMKGEVYKHPMSRQGFPATAECYLDRAIRWRPEDPKVRLIYGIYLQMRAKLNEALKQYKISEKMQPESADLNYNMGLLYFDLKQYALAKQYAKKAYQLGYPLPGLRKKLASVGQWP